MRVANVMLSRGLGGIEQAFLDYNEALLLAGHEVLAVTHPLAEISMALTGDLEHFSLSNLGAWDPLARRRLRDIYRRWKPDITISHGNRALLLNHFAKGAALHAAVTHNYRLKHFAKADAVIALTEDLAGRAEARGVAAEHIAFLPNMIRLPAAAPTPLKAVHEPLVIGAMGRMVAKKGFDHLLRAARILANQNLRFRIRIGGGGAEEKALKALVSQLQLQDRVEFSGWVSDKDAFFAGCDIFCLPSLHEPFGIVLLEAMAHATPVAAYASEGPSHIVQADEALLAPVGDEAALAKCLERLLQDTSLRQELAGKGLALVAERYSLPVISQKLDTILHGWQQNHRRNA